MDLWAGRKCG